MTKLGSELSGKLVGRLAGWLYLLLIPLTPAISQEQLDFTGEVTFSAIVRHRDLPRRMYLEPEFALPVATRYVEKTTLEFFERIVTNPPDIEILVEAIRSVEEIHQGELADVSQLADLLRKHLREGTSPIIRQVSASALASLQHVEAAKEVAAICVPQFESLCLQLEPDFVTWGGDALQETWLHRVQNSSEFSSALVGLACSGLSRLKTPSAAPALEELLENSSAPYSHRHAAAKSLARIDGASAINHAQGLYAGSLPERLLACALLSHCKTESGYAVLSKLCDDTSNAVASRAWSIAFETESTILVEKFNAGVQHADANVRMTAIRAMSQLPTIERCSLVQNLTSDEHIAVRNLARSKLSGLAGESAEWRQQIFIDVSETLRDPGAGWQELEQSLLLAGELGHSEWQAEAVRLLQNPRPEVFVTAAWLVHLMPRSANGEDIRDVIARKLKALQSVDDVLQVTFLYQSAGLLKLKSVQPLCEPQFKIGGDPEMRSAAMWALGKINEGTSDQGLVDRFVERIFDDNDLEPEDFAVRRMSMLALVWLNARSAASDIQRARDTYGAESLLGEAARWALPQLGAEQPPPLKAPHLPTKSFPTFPL